VATNTQNHSPVRLRIRRCNSIPHSPHISQSSTRQEPAIAQAPTSRLSDWQADRNQ
jgi:hypothetical protein